jgi:hypothetical protein
LVAFYTLEQESGLALGQLKLALHTRFDHTSLCVHDQLGFSKTFQRASSAFFGKLATGRDELMPGYTEVGVATIGEVPAGFDRRMIFRDGTQERRVSTSLLLLLKSPTELATSDSASSEVLNAQGRVVSAEFVSIESGLSDLKVSLERKQGGQYSYQGVVHGKPIEGRFTHGDKRGLPGGGLLEQELKKRAKKAGAFSLAHPMYNPYQDPTRATDRIYLRMADDPPNRIRTKRGETEVVGTIDADGRFEGAEATIGGQQIRFQRAYQRGKP